MDKIKSYCISFDYDVGYYAVTVSNIPSVTQPNGLAIVQRTTDKAPPRKNEYGGEDIYLLDTKSNANADSALSKLVKELEILNNGKATIVPINKQNLI